MIDIYATERFLQYEIERRVRQMEDARHLRWEKYLEQMGLALGASDPCKIAVRSSILRGSTKTAGVRLP